MLSSASYLYEYRALHQYACVFLCLLFSFIERIVFVKCLILLPGVFSDSIGPKEEDMNITRREGESVTLRCSYDTSSNNIYLYWYRQYPNREPEYLLWQGARSYGGEDKTDQRFKPTSSQSSTELTINSVTLSDSALYYCALRVAAQWYKVPEKLYKNSHTQFLL